MSPLKLFNIHSLFNVGPGTRGRLLLIFDVWFIGARIFGFNENGAGPGLEINVLTLSVENQKHVRLLQQQPKKLQLCLCRKKRKYFCCRKRDILYSLATTYLYKKYDNNIFSYAFLSVLLTIVTVTDQPTDTTTDGQTSLLESFTSIKKSQKHEQYFIIFILSTRLKN